MQILNHILLRILRNIADRLNIPVSAVHQTPEQHEADGVAAESGAGHIERNLLMIQEPELNRPIHDHEERWLRHDDRLTGETLQTMAVTASGELAKPKSLKSVCSVCRKPENCTIRSDISHAALCRTCQRKLTMPNGHTLILTPSEYSERLNNYNTWECLDSGRRLPER